MGYMRRRGLIASQPHLVNASGETLGISVAEPKIKRLAVTFAPVQTGSGTPSPSNVRPISGWTEIGVQIGGANICQNAWELGAINGTTGANASGTDRVRTAGYIPVIPGHTYALKRNLTGGYNHIRCYDQNKAFIGIATGNVEFLSKDVDTASQAGNPCPVDSSWVVFRSLTAYYLRFADMATTNPANLLYMIAEGSQVQDYVPYRGITPSISLGGTYYGGTVDLVSGVMTVTHGCYSFDGTEDWRSYDNTSKQTFRYSVPFSGLPVVLSKPYTTGGCSHFKLANGITGEYGEAGGNQYFQPKDPYGEHWGSTEAFTQWLAAQKTAGTPVQIYGLLATPQTVTLTPQTLAALRGQQTVTSPATQRENLWTESDPYEINPTNAPYGYRKLIFPTPLPPGTYRFSAAITSNDTDATTCCVRFMTENDADSSNRSETQSRIDRTANGESHSLDYVTTAATHHIYLYTSTNSPKSIGDTATYRNIRIERIDTSTGTIAISYWAVDDTVQQM